VHYILHGAKEGRKAVAEVSAKAPNLPTVVRQYRRVREVHYEVWQAPDSLKGKRVCLFVVYAPDGYVHKSTAHYIEALKRQGLAVIVIVASRNSGRPYADTEIICDGLISRDNFGYDFSCWALGLQILPSIWQANTIIFTNDSVFGPLSQPSLTRLIKRIQASPADYIALTQSWQVRHHYQSYFFALKEKALGHPGMKHFWSNLEVVANRDQAILRYEVPMLEMFKSFGLETDVLFPLANRDFELDMNPTLDHWRELVESDFPFIKVQVLRDDINGVDKNNWTNGIEMDADILAAIAERLDSGLEKNRKLSLVRPNK
jgi:lipopolysaccharide biosynthesis protein